MKEPIVKAYMVSNSRGGMDLGIFEATSEYGAYLAYLAMFRDAGYNSPTDVPGNEDLEQGELPPNIKITPLGG